MADSQAVLTFCPFTKQPFANCAVRVITGASIPRISRYCMGDYVFCPVYKKEYIAQESLNHNGTEKLPEERRGV